MREGAREVCKELKLGYGHKNFHSVLALKWVWKLLINQMVLATRLCVYDQKIVSRN